MVDRFNSKQGEVFMVQATDLILVDGSSFLYRAYFAAKAGLSTKSGFPTGATYIITRMLRNLVHDYANHKILMTFDAHGPSFRNQLYPEYKSNRPPMPEDLAVQVPVIHHIVAAMGFPIIAMPGVEADDVLGSYAKAASEQGLKVLICTGDKDLAQLVNEHISLKDTMKDITYTREEVINKYGVPPELIIDYLALKGDASDNIPGMKGVGDVTALCLLQNIGGVYTIKDNLDKVLNLEFRGKGTFGKRFTEQWPMIEISYKLATIKCDVPLPFAIQDIQVPQENNDTLIALFESLEFHRFASEQRAKKASFSALLSDVHGRNSEGDTLQKPQIVGLQLTPLVFEVPKGQDVGEVANPLESLPKGTTQSASTSDVASENKSKLDATSNLVADSASVSQLATDSAPVSQVTTNTNVNSESTVVSESSVFTEVSSDNSIGKSADSCGNGAEAASTHIDNACVASNSSCAFTEREKLETSVGTINSTQQKPVQADSSAEKASAGANNGLLDMQNSLLFQIESATEPDIMEKIRTSHSTKTSPNMRTSSEVKTEQTIGNEASNTGSTSSNATVDGATSNNATVDVATNNAPTNIILSGNEEQVESLASNISQEALLAVLKSHTPNENVARFIDTFHVVLTSEQLQSLVSKLKECESFAFSTASTSSQPAMSDLVGLSISLGEAESYYIPLQHCYVNQPEQLGMAETFAALQEFFSSSKIIKIAHDLKQHRLKLYFAGLSMSGPMLDTMVITHLTDPSQTTDLDNLASRYNRYNSLRYDESFSQDYWAASINQEISKAMKKECERALMPWRLLPVVMKELKDSYQDRADALLQFEMQILDVLYEMERTGTLVDAQELDNLTVTFNNELKNLQDQIYDEAGEQFKITSPRILGNILFEKMKIPYPKKTNKVDVKGHRTYSTSEEILSEVSNYKIVQLVQQYRALSKLITTYSEKLPELISKKTGRIHTNFNLAGTITGRLSSSEPNLQNIPARTTDGRMIRDAFIAQKGYTIVSADYSQIELRIIAHLSKDPNLKQAFLSQQDVHRVTASEVLGKPLDEVTDLERAHAKSTNYGLMYGMSFMGLARQTGMSNAAAKDYIAKYFTKYPSIKDFMEQIRRYATKYGYITSLDGRKIYINNIKSSGMPYRQACRAAINAPMQSGAADIIKHAMLDISKYIKTLEPSTVNMMLQVHDELVFEVKDTVLDEFCKKVKELMTNAYTLDVPLVVDVGCGRTWGLAH